MAIYQKVNYRQKIIDKLPDTIDKKKFARLYFLGLFYLAFAVIILLFSILLPFKILFF